MSLIFEAKMKSLWLAFVLGILVIETLGEEILEEQNEDIDKDSPNVCVDQVLENLIVNVTYMQTMDVMEYTWCVKIPPRCPTYKQKLIESVKQENVSRLVNHRKCCPGYKASEHKTCDPVCEEPCDHGVCIEPNVCSCDAGFTGPRCQKFGCPDGNWGTNCANKCPCENGGSCEANTGQCLCLPGWKGLHCQEICDAYHYGPNCQKKCKCASAGEKCYHVTGDCLPCSAGTFGAYCANYCDCNANGTALCYHLNGNCFCHANWYGPKCDLYCPFGYINGVCYDEPMNNGTLACSCPGDMYACDPERGCVCKDEKLCQGGSQIFSLAPLSAPQEESSNASVIGIVVAVLIVALIAMVLGLLYYRRRTKVLKKDLQNRSVYYVENSILDPARHHQIDLNSDALVVGDEFENGPLGGAAASLAAVANNMPNNLSDRPRYEKNVNINAYKLGVESDMPVASGSACRAASPATGGACRAASPAAGGACGSDIDQPFEVQPHKPSNINMMSDESPSKNNAKAKINKMSINNLIRNNLEDSDIEKDGDELEEDDVAISKMSNYLDKYNANRK